MPGLTPEYIGIIAGVSTFFVASVILLVVRLFTKSIQANARQVTLAESSIVSPFVLFLFRLVAALHAIASLVAFIALKGAWQWTFYTVWTYTMFTVYFTVRRVAHASGSRDAIHHMRFGYFRTSPEATMGWFGRGVQILFEVVFPVTFLVIIVLWSVLLPLAQAAGKSPEFLNEIFFNYWSYNMHGINGGVLIIEIALNRIPVIAIDGAFMFIYASVYSAFIFVNNHYTNWWPYPIVNVYAEASPLYYALLVGVHVLFYSISFIISQLKGCCGCSSSLGDTPGQSFEWGSDLYNNSEVINQNESSALLGQQYYTNGNNQFSWKSRLYQD